MMMLSLSSELAIGGAVLAWLALYAFPRCRKRIPYGWMVRPLIMTIQRRKFYCSLGDIRRGYRKSLVLSRVVADIAQKCRLVDMDANLQLWDTPAGTFWVPAASGLAHISYLLAEQRLKTYGEVGDGVRRGDVVFDCGANVGVFTREAILLGARLVVAFEPCPETVDCLQRNLAQEIAQGKVIVHAKGVWNTNCKLNLRIAPGNCGLNSFIPNVQGTVDGPQIEVTSIDKVTRDMSLDVVDFLKLDIEGAELEALKGAAATLGKWAPRVAVEVDHTDDRIANIRRIIDCALNANASYSVRSDLWVQLKDRRVYPGVLLFC
jgi:FkbM family methyltransferase